MSHLSAVPDPVDGYPVDDLVQQYRRRYPRLFGDLGALHARRGGPGLTWPSWCALPMAATASIFAGEGLPGTDLAAAHALSLWRLDRLVVDVDDARAEAALNQLLPTEIRGGNDWRDMPTAAIADLDLPAWCVYVPLPMTFRGAFAHHEHDLNTGRRELRILLDVDGTPDTLQPIIVYTDRPTLGRAVGDSLGNAKARHDQNLQTTPNLRGLHAHEVPEPVGAALAMVLPYLKAIDAYRGPGRPSPSRMSPWRPARTTTVWSPA